MSEKEKELDSILQRIWNLKSGLRAVTGRPQTTMRDTVSLLRQGVAAKIHNKVQAQQQGQQASQNQSMGAQNIPQPITSQPRTRVLDSFLRSQPPQQPQHPQPQTAEQILAAEDAEEDRKSKLASKVNDLRSQKKKQAESEKLRRQRGLNVDVS